MPGSGAAEGGLNAPINAAEAVRELGRREREAIAAGDWGALDEILEAQKATWRELIDDVNRRDESEQCRAATEALIALYEERRRNHALIERSFADLRRRLTTAHEGAGATSAYRRASHRAA